MLHAAHNPLLPAGYDLLWSVPVALIGAAMIALWIGALVSVVRSGVAGTPALLWILVILVAPFLGPILWFAWGRREYGALSR